MSTSRGVIFDLDGTLIDSEPQHHRALLAACRAGDAATACRLVADHVGHAAEQLSAFLDGRRPGPGNPA